MFSFELPSYFHMKYQFSNIWLLYIFSEVVVMSNYCGPLRIQVDIWRWKYNNKTKLFLCNCAQSSLKEIAILTWFRFIKLFWHSTFSMIWSNTKFEALFSLFTLSCKSYVVLKIIIKVWVICICKNLTFACSVNIEIRKFAFCRKKKADLENTIGENPRRNLTFYEH